MTRHARPFTLAALLFAISVLLYAAVDGPRPAVAADGKNLQVLPEDMSKSDIKSLMKTWTKALGVKCKACHTSDMAEDTAMKKKARDMVRMVESINGTYLKSAKTKVDCATCHRGKKEPAT